MKVGKAFAVWPSALSHQVVASLIICVVLVHRFVLWMLFGDIVLQVLDANQNWLTMQFLPITAYVDHFWTSLEYLQQTPPLPHVILALLAHFLRWPFGVSQALICLQFLMTAATSALLFQTLSSLACPRYIAAGIALFFGLSTDLFLFEVNSFGQLFYESGAMLCATALGACLCQGSGEATGTPPADRRALILAGVSAGLGILSRASFSYLAWPIALAIERRRGWRGALLFLIPVVLMQGTWALKNRLVYQHFTLSMSSWSGINAANGINFANGYGSPDGYDSEPFVASILSSPDLYPAWLIKVLQEHGYVDWDFSPTSEYMDRQVRDREATIQHAMGNSNPYSNSITIGLLSDQYARAALRYVFESPRRQIDKMRIGYHLFWQPIADYSGMFMGPLYVPMTHRTVFGGPYFFRSAEAFAKIQASDGSGPVKIRLPTLSLLFVDTVSWLCISLLLPLLMLGDCISRWRGRQPLIDGRLWTLIVVAGYGIAVSTMIDLGENMRFRLAFEPILICVTWGVMSTSVRAARRFRLRALGTVGWQSSRWSVPNRVGQTPS